MNVSAAHQAMLRIYATDASVYQEQPLAVAITKHDNDLKALINFARDHSATYIPRKAGTSLAGQVVAHGQVLGDGAAVQHQEFTDLAGRVAFAVHSVDFKINHKFG